MLTINDASTSTFPHAFAERAKQLVFLGYSPIPLLPISKRPYHDDWAKKWCNAQITEAEIAEVMRTVPDAGMGLANGAFTTSVDIDNARVLELIGPQLRTYGAVSKIGRDGRTDIFRTNPDAPEVSRRWKSKRDEKGNRHMLVEMLSTGTQTVLPPSTHPDTGFPYTWPFGRPLWDVPHHQLAMMPAGLGAWIEAVLLAGGLIDDPNVVRQQREARLRGLPEYESQVAGRHERYVQYARELLERKVAGLLVLKEGRHEGLHNAACAMGPYVSLGLIDEAHVEARLLTACEANGFFERELHAASRGAAKDFYRQVRRGIDWGEGLPPVNLRFEVREMFGALIPGPPVVGLPSASPVLDLVSGAQSIARSDVESVWMWDQWILRGNVTLISGDGGGGKSLALMQLLAHVSEGLPFMNNKVLRGPTLYVSAEDERPEVDRRVKAIKRVMPFNTLADFHTLCVDDLEDPSLFAPGPDGRCIFTPLLTAIEQIIATIRPVGVGLDPLADLFGGNEISRIEVRAFVSGLRKIARKYDCAIIMVGHPSVDGMKTGRGYSGSTAWNNSVRSRITFDASEDDDDVRVMTLAKSNRSKRGVKIEMRWINGSFVKIDPNSVVNDERLTDDQIINIVRIADSGVDYRYDPQSPEWFGYMVGEQLDIDVGHCGLKREERSIEIISSRKRIERIIDHLIKLGKIGKKYKLDRYDKQKLYITGTPAPSGT